MGYICTDCGIKYLSKEQKNENRVVTFHLGTCDECGEKKAITHERHYNYRNNPDDDARMRTIMQNGNTGEHYEK